MYSLSPELLYRVSGTAHPLFLHAGPVFEVWDIIDEKSEIRVGVQGAVSLTVPLRGKFGGFVAVGAAVIPSPFAADQLSPSFERRALWRRRFVAGLEYRL
jgi:hypothetical protein